MGRRDLQRQGQIVGGPGPLAHLLRQAELDRGIGERRGVIGLDLAAQPLLRILFGAAHAGWLRMRGPIRTRSAGFDIFPVARELRCKQSCCARGGHHALQDFRSPGPAGVPQRVRTRRRLVRCKPPFSEQGRRGSRVRSGQQRPKPFIPSAGSVLLAVRTARRRARSSSSSPSPNNASLSIATRGSSGFQPARPVSPATQLLQGCSASSTSSRFTGRANTATTCLIRYASRAKASRFMAATFQAIPCHMAAFTCRSHSPTNCSS